MKINEVVELQTHYYVTEKFLGGVAWVISIEDKQNITELVRMNNNWIYDQGEAKLNMGNKILARYDIDDSHSRIYLENDILLEFFLLTSKQANAFVDIAGMHIIPDSAMFNEMNKHYRR